MVVERTPVGDDGLYALDLRCPDGESGNVCGPETGWDAGRHVGLWSRSIAVQRSMLLLLVISM